MVEVSVVYDLSSSPLGMIPIVFVTFVSFIVISLIGDTPAFPTSLETSPFLLLVSDSVSEAELELEDELELELELEDESELEDEIEDEEFHDPETPSADSHLSFFTSDVGFGGSDVSSSFGIDQHSRDLSIWLWCE